MKKIIYLILTIFLGLILSVIVHAAVEVIYIKFAVARSISINWTSAFGFRNGQCALPITIQWLLLILGAFWGYFTGQRWWRYVYIEKKHWWFRSNNNS